MSLGITQLKAAAPKKWSCWERVSCWWRTEQTTCWGEVFVSRPITETLINKLLNATPQLQTEAQCHSPRADTVYCRVHACNHVCTVEGSSDVLSMFYKVYIMKGEINSR